jgi:hypothetical protein
MADNSLSVEITGLDPVIQKFTEAPKTINREMNKTMKASLEVVHEKILPYPPQRENMVRPYKRTGTLGKSLGVDQGGNPIGKPTVYSISGSGAGMEGRFGTNLSYAKYVISPDEQAYMHKNWWWTMDVIAKRAKDKIIAVWNEFIKRALGA